MEKDESSVKFVLEDYLKDYKLYNTFGYTLEAVMIYIETSNNKVDKIVVQDFPVNHFYVDIRDKGNKQNYVYKFGFYSGMPIEIIQKKEDIKLSLPWITEDSTLVDKANIPIKYYDSKGDTFYTDISIGLSEYEIVMESRYDLLKREKTIEFINGEVKTLNF